jgi:hypothetical protein
MCRIDIARADAVQRFSSTDAKQRFGHLLKTAASGPVEIERHGVVQVVVAAPEFFRPHVHEEATQASRRQARLSQQLTEQQRLIRHQHIALDLLTLPARDRDAMIGRARQVVQRWRDEHLCSTDYIERWSALLTMPVVDLARQMCADADGWGTALRQNSPWVGVAA